MLLFYLLMYMYIYVKENKVYEECRYQELSK